MELEKPEDAYYEGGMFFKPGFGVDEWEALQLRLPLGYIITGKVVHQALLGVFIDAGLGFPVLMHQGSFVNRTMQFPDDYPPLNSKLAGELLGFHGSGISNFREIIIGQISPNGATSR